MRYFDVKNDTMKLIDHFRRLDISLSNMEDMELEERYQEMVTYVVDSTDTPAAHRKTADEIAHYIVTITRGQAISNNVPVTLRAIVYSTITYILNSLYYDSLTSKELDRIGRMVHREISVNR